MLTNRQLFYQHLAQTSEMPLALEIEKAEGVYLYSNTGKKYLDLISGIAVSNVGHRHAKVLAAIHGQLEKYMHLMVYGEFIQSPQVQLAALLAANLPSNLNSTYFLNSGSEAVETALKLAKRYTKRTEIISFKNAYHGSTHGALSVMGNEELKIPFRPLLPDVRFLKYNDAEELNSISEKTACVICETIQGEAGVILPKDNFLIQLRQHCDRVGALLILDEIQCGFGRTGKLVAFEHFGIIPDILCFAKGMGGGMPIGAVISSREILSVFASQPALGHITTFGGHPLSCAASKATLEVLLEEQLMEGVAAKEQLFLSLLKHPAIKQVRSKGLFMAIEFENAAVNATVIGHCIENGLLVDWFLFCDRAMRIAPPLTINEQEIRNSCEMILNSINLAMK